MSGAITELLSSKKENFVRKYFPAGDYLCQIIGADILHGYWKPKPPDRPRARWVEVYVPTIQVVDYFPSGDEEIDAKTLEDLAAFSDDWKGFKPPKGSGRWAQFQQVEGFSDKILCAGIANGLNFILADTTPEWAELKEIPDSATRFYTSENSQGEVDGWVKRVLSTEPDSYVPPEITAEMDLGEVVKATEHCYLVASLKLEQDPNGEYEPKVVVDKTSRV